MKTSRVLSLLRVSFLPLLVVVALSACAPKSYVVLLDNPDGGTGRVTVTGQGGKAATLETSGQGVALAADPGEAFAVDQKKLDQDFGKALAATPKPAKHFLLYFQNNSTEMLADSQSLVPEILEAIRSRQKVDVSIIGHSDTAGNEDYNHRLALRRAQSVADMITATEGLDLVDVTVTSHGESNPVVKTADNVNEPKNRRVEVSIR